jgi:hypothetical protein
VSGSAGTGRHTPREDTSAQAGWREPAWWRGLVAGAACFDEGRYWEAHEHWEREWKAHAQLHRHYVKGLIQFAAACHLLAQGKLGPARRLLDLGPTHLLANRPLSWPFDTGHLVAVASAMARSIDLGRKPRLPRLHLERMMRAWAAEHREA